MVWGYVGVFIVCCFLLYFSGEWVVRGLMQIARFLGWREFVVAFFVMAFAGSLPNLFLGVNSALHKFPQLSLGDVVGGNVVDLTLAIALVVFFAKGKEIPAESRTVQITSFFTIVAAILPLILILDRNLSRIDGILLIGLFIFYIIWLFSKQERFTKIYEEKEVLIVKEFKIFIKDLGKVIFGISILILTSEGIIKTASFFAERLNLSLTLIGILIVGLGNALPEIYFALASARKNETWMILGDLMGAVVVPATLVLGVVSLISPIKILDPSSLLIARFFLILSALFFFFFVRTDRKITKKEAFFLLGIYILFFLAEILKY